MISSWLEKSSWPAVRIKYACINSFSGGTPDTSNTSYWNDGNVPWIASGELQNCDVRNATSYITNKGLANSSAKIIKKGSVAIAMTGATCANVGYITFDTAANQSVYAYIIKDNYNARFVYYSLIAMRDEILSKQNGGAQAGINGIVCKNLYIPKINLNDQKKIADYLDKKVGIIDRLIENINQQIEDLTKYKKSVVTEVITKGLKFGIKMKEDHTGKIPEYWEITNLKNVLTGIKDGTHGSYQRVQDGEYLLSAKNVFEDGLHISSNDSYISEKDYKSIVANGYPAKDDILICCVGTIGRCCIYNYDKPFAFQRSVSFLRPNKKTNSRYLLYVLKSENVQSQLNQMANASAQAGIYMGILKTVKIPYCRNGSEQFRMVVHLDTKCKHIDMLTKIKQQKIVELKKYKKSLIYECVTGKKEIL